MGFAGTGQATSSNAPSVGAISVIIDTAPAASQIEGMGGTKLVSIRQRSIPRS